VADEMNRELDHWFVSEILPHETALMRYLKRVWKSPAEISDLRQETYVRVYESASRALPRLPKVFLFTTARNLLVDMMRRERIVSIDYTQDLASLDVLVDELTPERRLSARQEFQRLTEAFDCLPETTRSAIWLRRVAGLSQREAAQALGIEEGALEGHMTRGLRRLAKAILSDSIYDKHKPDTSSDRGTEHGQRRD
jgi:RNA polymerase sigma factor (sigma-70 family)